MAKKKQERQLVEKALKKIEKLGGNSVWEREIFIVNLSDTGVTDADLAIFRDLPLAEEIHLDNTSVTDAGLEQLTSLKKLKKLSLVNTKVSKKGIATLQAALPTAAINDKEEKLAGINPFTGKPFPP